MPKETIHDRAAMYNVRIGWNRRGQYVQVGVEAADGRSVADHLTCDCETPADFTGLWGTLDEAGIDRAIAVLQRAKLQVYGQADPGHE